MKNPFIRAILAALYVVIIVFVMNTLNSSGLSGNSILGPVAMLSLLTLSAVVMGSLFFYGPFVSYSEGDKSEALRSFLQTLVTFAGITVIFIVLLFVL